MEQISGSTATFLVVNPTGVQGVYGSTGTTLELAVYSPYGTQTVSTGTNVTPFGFQGSYTDATGLIYFINRYYDPTTDSFLSVDPDVQQTDQPYVFTNDDPLNLEDPLGDCWGWCTFTDAAHAVATVARKVGGAVESAAITGAGVTLDTASLTLDVLAALDPTDPLDPLLSSGAVATGFAGAFLSASQCKSSAIGCIGAGFGLTAAATGGAELLIENEAAGAVLTGTGLTFGGAALTSDVAAIIVKVSNTIKKTVSKEESKKK